MRLKTIRQKGLYKRVWLDDVLRIDPADGSCAGPNIHLWLVEGVVRRQIVLFNESTHHRVALDARNVKQFDKCCEGMPSQAEGAFRLNAPVVLSGCNAFKSLAEYRVARRTRPQIFLPVTITSPDVMIFSMMLAHRALVSTTLHGVSP